MKLEDVSSLICKLNAGNDIIADPECHNAVETLDKILKLKTELRQRFDPDKLNELYRVIEGTL